MGAKQPKLGDEVKQEAGAGQSSPQGEMTAAKCRERGYRSEDEGGLVWTDATGLVFVRDPTCNVLSAATPEQIETWRKRQTHGKPKSEEKPPEHAARDGGEAAHVPKAEPERALAKRVRSDLMPEAETYDEGLERAIAVCQAFEEAKKRLLTKDDIQDIQGKAFIKRSGWRKIALMLGITTKIEKEEITRDPGGRVVSATFVVKASLPNGREAAGWGNCTTYEKKSTKPEHDVPATAMTRAVNRAISDLCGAGTVSAEEIGEEARQG